MNKLAEAVLLVVEAHHNKIKKELVKRVEIEKSAIRSKSWFIYNEFYINSLKEEIKKVTKDLDQEELAFPVELLLRQHQDEIVAWAEKLTKKKEPSLRYKVKVTSINVESSPNYDPSGSHSIIAENHPIGQILDVIRINFNPPIAFSGINPETKATLFSFLENSYHLNGGSWELMPYTKKEK